MGCWTKNFTIIGGLVSEIQLIDGANAVAIFIPLRQQGSTGNRQQRRQAVQEKDGNVTKYLPVGLYIIPVFIRTKN